MCLPVLKRAALASFTCFRSSWPYSEQTNSSDLLTKPSSTSNVLPTWEKKSTNLGSPNISLRGFTFPFPWKEEALSQPVKVCSPIIADGAEGWNSLRWECMAWTSNIRLLFPVPVSNHRQQSKSINFAMHRISTSVSGDWITMEFLVFLANLACSSRRLSASSWQHFSSLTSAIMGEDEVPAKQIFWQMSEWPMKRVKECPRPSSTQDLMKNSKRSSLFFPQDKYFFHWAGACWLSERSQWLLTEKQTLP